MPRFFCAGCDQKTPHRTLDTRRVFYGIRRRKQCAVCKTRITTREMHDPTYDHGNRKLPATRIIEAMRPNLSLAKIGERYGVSASAVWQQLNKEKKT